MNYEKGCNAVLELLPESSTLVEELRTNLREMRLFGDSRDISTKRFRIIFDLNALCLAKLDKTFTDLCR